MTGLLEVFAALEEDHSYESLSIWSDFLLERGEDLLSSTLLWIRDEKKWPDFTQIRPFSISSWTWFWHENYQKESHERIPRKVWMEIPIDRNLCDWWPYFLSLQEAIQGLSVALVRSHVVSSKGSL